MWSPSPRRTFWPMPRYLVERKVTDGWPPPGGGARPKALRSVIACNADRNVVWLHSYVSVGGNQMFCLYDAPSPESIRLASWSNDLPVTRITEVEVLDPYSFDPRLHRNR